MFSHMLLCWRVPCLNVIKGSRQDKLKARLLDYFVCKCALSGRPG